MNDNLFNLKAVNLMTKKPSTGNKDMLVGEALNIMNNKNQTRKNKKINNKNNSSINKTTSEGATTIAVSRTK